MKNRPVRPILLLVAMLLIGAADRVAISIVGNADLRCGSLRRGESHTIRHDDARAGEYIVFGEEGAAFRLELGVSAPAHDGASVELILSGDNCAYSNDNGSTWMRFPGGALSNDLRFPDGRDGATVTSVRVRVGGTFVVDGTRPRGEYQGRVLVSATYL